MPRQVYITYTYIQYVYVGKINLLFFSFLLTLVVTVAAHMVSGSLALDLNISDRQPNTLLPYRPALKPIRLYIIYI